MILKYRRPYNINIDKGSHLEILNYSQPAAVAVNDISQNESEWSVWFAEELRLIKADDQWNVLIIGERVSTLPMISGLIQGSNITVMPPVFPEMC